jgi:hypothetical protein
MKLAGRTRSQESTLNKATKCKTQRHCFPLKFWHATFGLAAKSVGFRAKQADVRG